MKKTILVILTLIVLFVFCSFVIAYANGYFTFPDNSVEEPDNTEQPDEKECGISLDKTYIIFN